MGAEQRWVRTGNRVTKRSGVARTKFISSGADNRAVRLTIGCKPSANSKAERCRARRPSRHRTRATHGREDAYKSTVAMLGEAVGYQAICPLSRTDECPHHRG